MNLNVIRTDAPVPAPSADSLAAYPGVSLWPMRSSLQLPALPPAVPSARLHARKVLAEWGLEDTGTVELIVSELVTNAVRACLGRVPVRLWISCDGDRVAVQVWDAADRMPVPKDPGPDDSSGRGLVLVRALSADWGSYKPAALSGKVCWAIITIKGETA